MSEVARAANGGDRHRREAERHLAIAEATPVLTGAAAASIAATHAALALLAHFTADSERHTNP